MKPVLQLKHSFNFGVKKGGFRTFKVINLYLRHLELFKCFFLGGWVESKLGRTKMFAGNPGAAFLLNAKFKENFEKVYLEKPLIEWSGEG